MGNHAGKDNIGHTDADHPLSHLLDAQLLRVCRRLSHYPEESLQHAVSKACLSRFLPSLARASLQKNLSDCSVSKAPEPAESTTNLTCSVKDGVLTIGSVAAPVSDPGDKMKVPDVLFYDNPQ
ncbi:hypothetical protein CRUP_037221, partial [Coryphaenoides rupestris]